MGPSWSSLKLLLQLLGQMLVLVSRVSSWRDPIEHDHEDKSVHIGYLLEDFSRAGAINNTTTRTSQSTLGIYWRISAERERSTTRPRGQVSPHWVSTGGFQQSGSDQRRHRKRSERRTPSRLSFQVKLNVSEGITHPDAITPL